MNEALPDGWVWTTLDKVALIQGGIQKQQKRRPVHNRYPFLRVANIGRGSLDLDVIHEIELFDGELDRFMLEFGDLLVVEGNGSADQLGRAAMWRNEIQKCVHQNHLIRVRPSSLLDPSFLQYLWNSPVVTQQLRRVASSTSGLHTLSTAKLKRIEIPLPPFAEQLRIVEILEDHLSRLDAANRYIARVRQSTTSFDKTQRRELLDPWLSSTRKLKTLLASRLINGRSVPTDDDGFPVLRLTAIKNRVLDLSARKGGSWQREDATPFLVERGDFMVSRGNGSLRLVGRGALAVDDPDPVAFPDTMIRVRPNLDVVDPEFLAFVWDSQTVRRQIEAAARTTAGIYKINQSILEALDIPIPPLDVQARIVGAALDHFTVIERLMEEAAMAQKRSEHLRRSLLVEAFTGRLAQQDSADEPAMEILKRTETEHYSRPKSLRSRKSGPNKTTLPPPKITVVPTGTQEELAL
ncbi:restriction endonuclease subunit S [Nonomuraea sp. NPDC050680]|uniref:restriction endonuclease subunit S n=1 Tax=Nonomuraea sp. NPDC050680 TaxID=3154630 RepID=UPI0033C0DFDD